MRLNADQWDKIVGWVCFILFVVYIAVLYTGGFSDV